jgi:hypothetical protein
VQDWNDENATKLRRKGKMTVKYTKGRDMEEDREEEIERKRKQKKEE